MSFTLKLCIVEHKYEILSFFKLYDASFCGNAEESALLWD